MRLILVLSLISGIGLAQNNSLLLLSPANESVVASSAPIFSWTNNNMASASTFILVQVQALNKDKYQSAEQAMVSNPVYYTQTVSGRTSLVYPMTAPRLQPGRYAWRVISVGSGEGGAQASQSEVFVFEVEEEVPRQEEQPPAYDYYGPSSFQSVLLLYDNERLPLKLEVAKINHIQLYTAAHEKVKELNMVKVSAHRGYLELEDIDPGNYYIVIKLTDGSELKLSIYKQ